MAATTRISVRVPGSQPSKVSRQLSSSVQLQPVSRNTARGGNRNAQMILQKSIHVTVMLPQRKSFRRPLWAAACLQAVLAWRDATGAVGSYWGGDTLTG